MVVAKVTDGLIFEKKFFSWKKIFFLRGIYLGIHWVISAERMFLIGSQIVEEMLDKLFVEA